MQALCSLCSKWPHHQWGVVCQFGTESYRDQMTRKTDDFNDSWARWWIWNSWSSFLFSRFASPLCQLLPTGKKRTPPPPATLGWEPASQCCQWVLSLMRWTHLHQRDPSTAALEEDVCGLQEILCWKVSLIWSHSTSIFGHLLNFSANPCIRLIPNKIIQLILQHHRTLTNITRN